MIPSTTRRFAVFRNKSKKNTYPYLAISIRSLTKSLIDISQVVITLVSQYDTIPFISDPTLRGA